MADRRASLCSRFGVAMWTTSMSSASVTSRKSRVDLWKPNDSLAASAVLAFDVQTATNLAPGKDGYELFADANDNELHLAENSRDREKGPGYSRAKPPVWSVQIPVRARAMVLAGDKLYLAGPPDVVPQDDPYAAFEGRRGAKLWVVSATDGTKLAEYDLPTPPVFDGLIAANGRLYIACSDGRIVCMQ